MGGIPKVTRKPSVAPSAARSNAAWKRATGVITWSAVSTAIVASGSRARTRGGAHAHRRRVAQGLGLADDLLGWHVGQLGAHGLHVLGIGQDPHPLGRHAAGQAVHGLHEHGGLADQRQQLLGPRAARPGPQAGAAAAGEDEGMEGRGRHGRAPGGRLRGARDVRAVRGAATGHEGQAGSLLRQWYRLPFLRRKDLPSLRTPRLSYAWVARVAATVSQGARMRSSRLVIIGVILALAGGPIELGAGDPRRRRFDAARAGAALPIQGQRGHTWPWDSTGHPPWPWHRMGPSTLASDV